VVTYDGTTVRWYLDGILSSSTAATATTAANTDDMKLGGGGGLSDSLMYVDEPALYATALSADKVDAHYKVGRSFRADPCRDYRVFANVTDHGSPPTGITSVTADMSAVTSGATAVPMVAGSYTVRGVAYNYRSAPLTAQVQPGSYGYSVTSVDGAGTHVQTGLTVAVGSSVAGTPTWLTGFESGTLGADAMTTNTGGTIDTSAGNTLKIVKTSGTYVYAAKAGLAASTASLSFDIKLETLPTSNANLVTVDMSSTTDLKFGYIASSKKFNLGWVGLATSQAAVSAGFWYHIDLRYDATANPNQFVWQVDGVTQTTVTSTLAAQTVVEVRFGSMTTNEVFTAYYDNIVYSPSLYDYPLGRTTVVGLWPNGMGTHNTSSDFQQEDGSAVSSTTYQRLDDSAFTSIADGVRQTTTSVTSYLELTTADTAAPCVRGVQAVTAQHKTSNQANTMKTSVFSGTTERVVWSGDSVTNGSVTVKTATVAPVAVPWATSELNALVFRIGYSLDAAPPPYWDALMLEVATGT
jgi:hypothetical protein